MGINAQKWDAKIIILIVGYSIFFITGISNLVLIYVVKGGSMYIYV